MYCDLRCRRRTLKLTDTLWANTLMFLTSSRDSLTIALLNRDIRIHGTSAVARWIRSILKDAGVDTSIFKTHSVREAATSAAANAFVPLQEILNMADWSNSSTFQRFYYRLHKFWTCSTFKTIIIICFLLLLLLLLLPWNVTTSVDLGRH